ARIQPAVDDADPPDLPAVDPLVVEGHAPQPSSSAMFWSVLLRAQMASIIPEPSLSPRPEPRRALARQPRLGPAPSAPSLAYFSSRARDRRGMPDGPPQGVRQRAPGRLHRMGHSPFASALP